MARIGYLSKAGSHVPSAFDSFVRGLRDQGFVEGSNLSIDYRLVDGGDDELQVAAAALAEQRVDLILARCSPETKAARMATQTIPIVMIALTGDPVASGAVASLSQPGGNVTGLTVLAPELSGKRVDVLKEAFPSVRGLSVIYDTAIPENAADLDQLQRAARLLDVQIDVLNVKGTEGLDGALATAVRNGNALTTLLGSHGGRQAPKIINAQKLARLPAIFELREFAEAGGIMSYGPSLREIYGRAATYAAKILRGAKPADLPVERPTRFELVVNLKSAESLAMLLPRSILEQAADILR
jgi:putative ABC transport system substrate-binding protein